MDPMVISPDLLPAVPIPDKRCPDRVEVKAEDQIVPAATVKTWVAHLRTHGWTDKDLGLVWLSRTRQGVTR